MNKWVADQISLGVLIKQFYVTEAQLLDRYIPPHEYQNTKDYKGGLSKDMISHILNKIEGSDKNFKYIKENVSTLSQTVSFHFVSIKRL